MKISHFLGIAITFVMFGFSTNLSKSTEIITIYGDLDKDKVDEKIVVCELEKLNDSGKIRTIEIFKKNGDFWEEWIPASQTAIMGSTAGGQMGDPFFNKTIIVKKGTLIIKHEGGSSWKWNVTHKYRYQNGIMQLVGYTTKYGKDCENWVNFDYNLLSGNAAYSKEFQKCESDGIPTIIKTDDEMFIKKLNKNITLQTINNKSIEIITPKYKETITF